MLTLMKAMTQSSSSVSSATIAASAGLHSRSVAIKMDHSVEGDISSCAHMHHVLNLYGAFCRSTCSIMRAPSPSSVRSVITLVSTKRMFFVIQQSTRKTSKWLTEQQHSVHKHGDSSYKMCFKGF